MGGYIGVNGKENGNYFRILGSYRDNGKQNGYLGLLYGLQGL